MVESVKYYNSSTINLEFIHSIIKSFGDKLYFTNNANLQRCQPKKHGILITEPCNIHAAWFFISRKTTVISRGTQISRNPSVLLSEPTHLFALWVLGPQRFVSRFWDRVSNCTGRQLHNNLNLHIFTGGALSRRSLRADTLFIQWTWIFWDNWCCKLF